MSQFGLAEEDLDRSIPSALLFLQKLIVISGHCLATFPTQAHLINEESVRNLKQAGLLAF